MVSRHHPPEKAWEQSFSILYKARNDLPGIKCEGLLTEVNKASYLTQGVGMRQLRKLEGIDQRRTRRSVTGCLQRVSQCSGPISVVTVNRDNIRSNGRRSQVMDERRTGSPVTHTPSECPSLIA